MRFYFDFISPYAYLAWHQIHELAEEAGREVEPVPILFAALLNHWGQKGPAEIPPKRLYVFKDTLRSAHILGLPLSAPPSHPFNPLPALRAAALDLPGDERRVLIDRVFSEVWGGGEGADTVEKLSAIGDDLGIAALSERIVDPEVKLRVRANTERALEDGVFGVPTVVCDGELFWGYDSLPHLRRFLSQEDPLPGSDELLARWGSIKPTAQR